MPSEPGPYQLGVNPGTNWASVSSLCNGNNHTAGGKIFVKGGLQMSEFTLFLLQAMGPHPPPQPEAHSRRPGNALRKEVRATSCPQAHYPEPGLPPLLQPGPVAFLRWGRRRKKVPSGPAPSGRGGRGEAPRGGRHAPRGVCVARGAPHEVCFLPPAGGGGRAERGGGRGRGDLTSGREVLSSRELSGRVSGPAGTRRAPPAPPAPCQDAADRARGRVDGRAARESQCGAQERS